MQCAPVAPASVCVRLVSAGPLGDPDSLSLSRCAWWIQPVAPGVQPRQGHRRGCHRRQASADRGIAASPPSRKTGTEDRPLQAAWLRQGRVGLASQPAGFRCATGQATAGSHVQESAVRQALPAACRQTWPKGGCAAQALEPLRPPAALLHASSPQDCLAPRRPCRQSGLAAPPTGALPSCLRPHVPMAG